MSVDSHARETSTLYIAFTPYHVFLATILAGASKGPKGAELIVISDFADSEGFTGAIQTWAGNPFRHIHLFPGAYGLTRKAVRQLAYATTVPRLRRRISGLHADEVCVFNDARPEAQAALHGVRARNPGARIVFGEDGLTAYGSHRRAPAGMISKAACKALFGAFWKDVTVLGTSPWIEGVWALFPACVRAELRRHPVLPIPHQPEPLRSFAEHVLRSFVGKGTPLHDYSGLDVVVVITHSQVSSSLADYRTTVRGWILDLADAGWRVAMKYHPREPLGDYLQLAGDHRIVQLPRAIPIELVYAFAGEGLRVIVGDVSSALLSARWMCREASVLTLAPAFGYRDVPLMQVFRTVGIRGLKGPYELIRTVHPGAGSEGRSRAPAPKVDWMNRPAAEEAARGDEP